MAEFEVYSIGIAFASVCTSLSNDEAAERLNATHPTGIISKWTLADDKWFATGHPMPCPCEHSPETHRHLLFKC